MKLKTYTKKISFISFLTLSVVGCGGGGGGESSGNANDNNTSSISNPSSTSDVGCSITKILDDSSFIDSFPSDIPWSGSANTVEDIERVFNKARKKDSTISQMLTLPSQSVWDNMSIEQRGLYIINNERYYRGIKPYEGASSDVSNIALSYANVLYNTGTFGHGEDDSPWNRLDRNTKIANNKDFFSFAENLYAHGSSSSYAKNPTAQAIYGFIYNDDASTNGSFGHRNFCLATGLNDNSGKSAEEGIIGFGIKQGKNYSYYPNAFSTIFVMNAFDPSSSWNHNSTIRTHFCSN